MKKHLLFLIISFINIQLACAQNYFPTSNAVWSVDFDKYFINGDTTISGKIYHKVFKSPFDSSFNYTNAFYYASFREDTAAKRVYRVKSGESIEKLLYDFSLNTGDSVVVYPIGNVFGQANDSIMVRVDELFNNTLHGYSRNFIRITDPSLFRGSEYWIDGIGSTSGLFFAGVSTQLFIDEGGPHLYCLKVNGTEVYEPGSSCYPVGIERIKAITPRVRTTEEKIIIESGQKNSTINCYDILGRPVYMHSSETGNFELDREILPTFIIYRIEGNNGMRICSSLGNVY